MLRKLRPTSKLAAQHAVYLIDCYLSQKSFAITWRKRFGDRPTAQRAAPQLD